MIIAWISCLVMVMRIEGEVFEEREFEEQTRIKLVSKASIAYGFLVTQKSLITYYICMCLNLIYPKDLPRNICSTLFVTHGRFCILEG